MVVSDDIFLYFFLSDVSAVIVSACVSAGCVYSSLCVPVRLGEEERQRQAVGGSETSVWGINTEVHDVTRVNGPAHAVTRDKPEQMRRTC